MTLDIQCDWPQRGDAPAGGESAEDRALSLTVAWRRELSLAKRFGAIFLSMLAVCAVAGQKTGAPEASLALEVVDVVAPLNLEGGAGALNIQAASAEQIAAARALDLADFLKRNAASVFVNEAQGNPLQGDVQYRGFVGSPLLGLSQGIAVYQDAVRVNEPFGDTVNWALLPESAIGSVLLVPGSSPLFGTNALGGALAVTTKDGFAHPGRKAALSAGSFGRRALTVETGASRDDRFAHFATAAVLREEGWRDFSPTDATQGFGKLTWQRQRARVDLSVALAATDLVGNGAAPEQLLTVDRTAIFTRPDRTQNELALFSLRGERDFSDRVLAQGNLYWRASDIETYNGDDSDYEACDEDDAYLCLDDELAVDRDGLPLMVEEGLEGATVNRTETAQKGMGFGLQIERFDAFAGGRNRLVIGLAVDVADIDFAASTELGRLDETRLAIPGGVFAGDAFTEVEASTSTIAPYLANTFAPKDRLRLTASARYNRSRVVLRDGLGTALDGDHVFRRLNLALAANYQAARNVALFAAYGESNRAPTPVELTCADEDAPCRLPNAFLADPPLEQVVARTLEVGARGKLPAFDWRLAWFGSRNDDDILFISAGAFTNEGFFDNVGTTARSGFELSLDGRAGRATWFLHLTQLSATFEDAFDVASANHPQATAGEIAVRPGDRLPLLPERLLKAGFSWQASERAKLGGEALHSSGFHLRGDEANTTAGIGGHTVVNLRADYRFDQRFTGFVLVENALDERYATFGVFGDAEEVLGEHFDNSRFVTPAAPRAGWLGIEFAP